MGYPWGSTGRGAVAQVQWGEQWRVSSGRRAVAGEQWRRGRGEVPSAQLPFSKQIPWPQVHCRPSERGWLIQGEGLPVVTLHWGLTLQMTWRCLTEFLPPVPPVAGYTTRLQYS